MKEFVDNLFGPLYTSSVVQLLHKCVLCLPAANEAGNIEGNVLIFIIVSIGATVEMARNLVANFFGSSTCGKVSDR